MCRDSAMSRKKRRSSSKLFPVVVKTLYTNKNDTTTGNLTFDSAGGTVIIDDELSVAATTTLASILDLSTNRIINVATPTATTDAANKAYVDTFVQGLVWQEPVLTSGSTTPPVSPTTGDRHVVGVSATGAWAGEDHNSR